MRERSGRQDVPERKRPEGLARLASAANATNESGGEAEIAGRGGCGVGPRRGVYGALVGRLIAQRRDMLSAGRRGMIAVDGKTW
jgi:hypothetical protein